MIHEVRTIPVPRFAATSTSRVTSLSKSISDNDDRPSKRKFIDAKAEQFADASASTHTEHEKPANAVFKCAGETCRNESDLIVIERSCAFHPWVLLKLSNSDGNENYSSVCL